MSFYQVSRARIALWLLLVFTFSHAAFAQARIELPAEPAGADFGRRFPVDSAISGSLASRTVAELADGDVDTTFAPQFDQAYGFAYSAEEQTDGKIVLAGGFKSINGFATESVVRFNADRSVDTTFRASVRGSIQRLIIQPDGKILIAGFFTAYNSNTTRPGVARLNSDGSLDPTFNPGTGANNSVRDILLLPDGKLIVVGDFSTFNGVQRRAIARLNSDGSVDETFFAPITTSPSSSTAFITGVALRADGKLVVNGAMYLGGPQVYWVLRLNPDGSPDGSFTPPSMNSNASKVAVQPDNKIILVGFFTTVAGQSRNRVVRLMPDGALDETFNPGTGANSSVLSVRVLTGGRIAITGNFSSFNGTPRGRVAILNPEGGVDATFASSGTTNGAVYNVLPTSAGGYLVMGSFSQISDSAKDTVAYFNAAGAVDPGFSATSLQYASVRAIIPQAGGKLIIGGFFNRMNGAPVNGIIRLNPDGNIDPTFASGVTVSGVVGNVVTQPDGKLIVLGNAIRINNGPAASVARLNADGTPDGSFTLGTLPAPQIVAGITAAVDANGGILLSYQTTSAEPLQGYKFVRLNADGSHDTLFGTISQQIEAVSVLADGKIMLAGPFSFGYVNSTTGMTETHNGVIRLNSDGTHDRTFRSAMTSDQSAYSSPYAMRVQTDGKILVGGRLFASGSTTPLGVVRLNATGTVDGSFQPSTIGAALGLAHVYSIDQTSDGKILAAGPFDTFGGIAGRSVVRLAPNGVIDPSFGALADNSVWKVTTDSSGKVLIGGTFTKVNGSTRAGLARLLNVPAEINSVPFDFDGDGKTDIGIFRPNGPASEWWINRSGNGQTFALQFGASTDKITPTDYTGDGKADIAFFRPSSGEWYVLRSEDFSFFALPFGANGDVPVPADYDADGKADFAVFRPSNSNWYVSQSSGAPTQIFQFGVTGDVPVVADYDGDGKADVGIFRQAAGGAEWWINRSTAGPLALQFGANSDKAVQGDYTGDGKADIAIWRPASGEWMIVRSEDFSFFGFPFGANGDTVAPGDYDGDGKFDPTVFRPSSATWFIARTTAGTQIVQFGATGDQPIPNSFVP